MLVLGGARSDYERDALELFAEGLEAGCHGCLMGRNVTKSPDPEKLIRQFCQVAHEGYSVDDALRGKRWEKVRLKANMAKCTGCSLCVTACVGAHDEDQAFSTHSSRLWIEDVRLGLHKIQFCTLCKKCINVCPTRALKWHTASGAVELLVDRCTACDKCVEICPTGVIARGEGDARLDWVPVICDLCSGDPACVRICPTQAIYMDERMVIR